MNDKCIPNPPTPDIVWLEKEDPEIYHLLRGLDHDTDALAWLRRRGEDLYLFAKALDGDKHALDAIPARQPSELAAVFDMITHCDVEQWLDENHPDLHRLFAFVRGDESALRGLKHRKTTCKRLAETLRAKYRDYHEDNEDGDALNVNGPAEVPQGAAADVGCLIGEMHLQNDEFHKAVEAFSRAVETNPTADAYEGRGRAYRALAALDESAAQLLRDRVKA
jgi:tetratricopeptide (TPR) repeat protein